jgi:molybdate transport system substrate-binding protein
MDSLLDEPYDWLQIIESPTRGYNQPQSVTLDSDDCPALFYAQSREYLWIQPMTNAVATEIKVLSAGAVEPGMVKVIDSFRRETRHDVKVTFATAPTILKYIGEANIADVVIAPPAVLDEWIKAGKAASANRVTVGKIGVGVMVRNGAPAPNIDTVEDFKRSLLNAESIVYNQASTGISLEALFDRLGIAEGLKTKTTRYPDAAAVLNHVSTGKGQEIGFGAVTVIIEGEDKGLKLVGPLPAEIQNYTTYAATVTADGGPAARQEFIRYLTSPSARKTFTAAGIE